DRTPHQRPDRTGIAHEGPAQREQARWVDGLCAGELHLSGARATAEDAGRAALAAISRGDLDGGQFAPLPSQEGNVLRRRTLSESRPRPRYGSTRAARLAR